MDSMEVGPCGHKAIQKGTFVKIYASSLANEIPAELTFSTYCAKNDRTRNVVYKNGFRGKQIYDGQHHSGIDFTEVRCENTIDQSCTMVPTSTWHQWSTERRLRIVTGKCRGKLAWHYILLVDDEETIKAHTDKQGEKMNVHDYGKILDSGWGKDPSSETQEMIREKYHVNYSHYN